MKPISFACLIALAGSAYAQTDALDIAVTPTVQVSPVIVDETPSPIEPTTVPSASESTTNLQVVNEPGLGQSVRDAMVAILPDPATGKDYTINVRLDVFASTIQESNLELDWYLNERYALGVLARVSESFSDDDSYYAVGGLRFNRYFNSHNQNDWYFSLQGYGIHHHNCAGYYYGDGGDKYTENCFNQLSLGLEMLQNWQWIFASGFNVQLGIGGKFIMQVAGDDDVEPNSWLWRPGVRPAMETSIGWAF